MQRVELNAQHIGLSEVEIFLELVDGRMLHVGVITNRADVKIILVVQKADFRFLHRRISIPRPRLEEVLCGQRLLPGGLFELAIDRDLFVDAQGGGDLGLTNGFVVDRRRLRKEQCVCEEIQDRDAYQYLHSAAIVPDPSRSFCASIIPVGRA